MFPAISALDALGCGKARARGGAALCCGVASAASDRLPAASPTLPLLLGSRDTETSDEAGRARDRGQRWRCQWGPPPESGGAEKDTARAAGTGVVMHVPRDRGARKQQNPGAHAASAWARALHVTPPSRCLIRAPPRASARDGHVTPLRSCALRGPVRDLCRSPSPRGLLPAGHGPWAPRRLASARSTQHATKIRGYICVYFCYLSLFDYFMSTLSLFISICLFFS